MIPLFLQYLGRACYNMGDYAAALATARMVCRSYPNFQAAYRVLIAALGQTGEPAEAQRVMAEALARFGEAFRFLMRPVGMVQEEELPKDREHMLEGYRKAAVLD